MYYIVINHKTISKTTMNVFFNIITDVSFYKEHNIFIAAQDILLIESQVHDNKLLNLLLFFKLRGIKINIVPSAFNLTLPYSIRFNEFSICSAYLNGILSFNEYVFIVKQMIDFNYNLNYSYYQGFLFENVESANKFIKFLCEVNNDFDEDSFYVRSDLL